VSYPTVSLLPHYLPLILCGDFYEAPRNSSWQTLTKTIFEDAAAITTSKVGPDHSFRVYFVAQPPAPLEMIE